MLELVQFIVPTQQILLLLNVLLGRHPKFLDHSSHLDVIILQRIDFNLIIIPNYITFYIYIYSLMDNNLISMYRNLNVSMRYISVSV